MTNNDNLEVSLFIATSTQSEALALSLMGDSREE